MEKIERGLHWSPDSKRARFEVQVPGTAQRRRKFNVAVEGKADARKLFHEFRELVTNPTHLFTAKPVKSTVETFESYTRSRWPISKKKKKRISAKTAAKEFYALEGRIFPAIGRLPFDNIDDNEIENWVSGMTSDGLKVASRNGYLRIAHKILAHAKRELNIAIPCLPEWNENYVEEEATRYELTVDEVKKFLRTFDDVVIPGGGGGQAASNYNTNLFRWSKPLFEVAIFCGLSRVDLLALRWTQVKFNWRGDKGEGHGLIALNRSKTNEVAQIPLCKRSREALRLCQSRKLSSDTSDLVFRNANGEPYSESAWRRNFLTAKKAANLGHPLRPHDLRRTFATLLHGRNVPLPLIQRGLGHSNQAQTEAYIGKSSGFLAPVAAALDSLGI